MCKVRCVGKLIHVTMETIQRVKTKPMCVCEAKGCLFGETTPHL